MRSLLIVGLISAFAASGFLPAESGAYASGTKVVRSISDQASVLVDRTIKGDRSIFDLGSSVLGSLLPSANDLWKTGRSFSKKSDVLAALHADLDSPLDEYAHRVQFAVQKQDARLCSEFSSPESLYSVPGYSPGDLTAFCLAAVAREAGRCAQIDVTETSDLRAACEQTLGTSD